MDYAEAQARALSIMVGWAFDEDDKDDLDHMDLEDQFDVLMKEEAHV